MLLILGLFLFLLLVVIHEYGHFLVAKRNGVEAEEFGIGFPPKVVGKTMGKGIFRTHYSLNLLPLGGFVRLKGESDSDRSKGSFGSASLWVKTKISLAGVGMNFLAAIILLSVLAVTGMPNALPNQFTVASDTTSVLSEEIFAGSVEEDSPASRAGLESGDELISLGGVAIGIEQQLADLTQQFAGQEVVLEYTRGGETFSEATTLNESGEEQGFLGVIPTQIELRKSTWSAPIVGAGLTAQFSWETLKGIGGALGNLVTGNTTEASEAVSGPVGIFTLLSDLSQVGLTFVLFFIALISLTLGVVNLLPIPALDGGSLYLMLLFRAMKKPLTEDLETKIKGTGMALLFGLIILITIVDINRL